MEPFNQHSQLPNLTTWVKHLDDAILAYNHNTDFKAGVLKTGQHTFEICVFTLNGQDYLYAKFNIYNNNQAQLYRFEGHPGLKEVLPPALRNEGLFSLEQILAAFETADMQEMRKKTIRSMLAELLKSMVMLNVEPSDIVVYLLIGVLWTFVEMGSFFITQLQQRTDELGPWLVYFLFLVVVFLISRVLGQIWPRPAFEPTSDEVPPDQKSASAESANRALN